MRGKPGIRNRDSIKCPKCGSYDIIALISLGREDSMCQRCGFVIENVKK